MSAAGYPHIDIAAHERVRERFAAGEALALFHREAASGALNSPIWANGPGARLFGFRTIGDFLARGPNGADVVYRQVEAASSGLAAKGDATSFTVLAVSGFRRVPAAAICELIDVDGETVLLLALPPLSGPLSASAIAARMVEGFEGSDTHLAAIGADGEVLAASEHFAALGVSQQSVKMLVNMAQAGGSRLTRRPVATAKGYLPAVLALLGDQPQRHLLLLAENVEGQPAIESELEFEPPETAATARASQLAGAIDAIASIEDGEESAEAFSVETANGADIEDRESPGAPAQPHAGGFEFSRDRRASRFVWKTDPDGRFRDVSPELAGAVGPHAAAIEGKLFSELAERLHLDPDGRIAAHLARRDTWSGKTIWWPVEGTALVVPIDLAALPTYSRDREFDGFRGFGVVRIADATDDPHATGLTLRPEEAESDTAANQALDEPPALAIAETPGRRHADKVVRHEESRFLQREGLTPVEQAAFQEIARRLETVTGPRAALGAEAGADAVATPPPPPPIRFARPTETGSRAPDREKPYEEAPAIVANAAPKRERLGLCIETIDQIPVALLILSGEKLIHANPAFLELSGFASLAALETAGGLDALIERQTLHDGSGGVVLMRADGDAAPVSARLQSVRWDETTALLLTVTPIQAAAVASYPPLHLDAGELQDILENAADGVVTIGADGEIRALNSSAARLFQYESDEVAGKPFVTLFAHESQRAILDHLAGLSGHGVASILNEGREVTGRDSGGGALALFLTIGRLASSGGYCAVMRDISHWKRTEEELRKAKQTAEAANAHKSAFLTQVSHEIRTPLNAIIGFSEMMSSERFGPVGNPRYAEYAEDIGRSGRHVLDIVNDLLDISKIEAGEMDLDFTAVTLNATVTEAVALVQPQAAGQRVIIRTALSQSVPDIVADLRSIKQIVINILANAIRFTPAGGQVVVSSVYEANGSVVLRVRDTGIGMTQAELELAMKPFRQVGAAARRRGDGTGLGLPLTRAMVEANRASFTISSRPDEGTLVEITFPSPRVLAT